MATEKKRHTTKDKLAALKEAISHDPRAHLWNDTDRQVLLEALQEFERADKERERAYNSLGSLLEVNGFDGLDDLLDQVELNGEPITEAARKLLASRHPEENTVTVKHPSNLDYPLDKPNTELWDFLEEDYADGQLSFDFITRRESRKGGTKEATVAYSVFFDKESLEEFPAIAQRLTPYDKRVYLACASLYGAGNDIVSLSQIAKMMGIHRAPNKSDLDKISESLTKMRAAIIHLDNQVELNVGYKSPNCAYDGSLLPFERISAYINGKLSEAAVHLFTDPPLVAFARKRKQITTIKREYLDTGLNMTDATLRLEDYFLERLSRINRDSTNTKKRRFQKIKLEDIYKDCGITTKKQKQRLPEKIRTLLDHYQATGFISGYEEIPNGYKILP